MTQDDFVQLVKTASACDDLPAALTLLQQSEDEEVAEVAVGLKASLR